MSYDYPDQPEIKPPRFDVYSMMLLIALIALIIGCVFLGLEMQEYDWQPKPS
jgi:hypothetical protein